MATMQLQKTRTTNVTKTIAINQTQSVEVVQTMLHGGLSTLCYLRQFFAAGAFDQRLYDSSTGLYTYEDYAAGKLPRGTESAEKPYTNMQVLRRGRSKRVDSFLNLLEHGAFEALRAGDLRAVQICVHPDPHRRQDIIEMYTFSISYAPDTSGGQRVSGMCIEDAEKNEISVGATNADLQKLVREVIRLCGTLPALPERRYLSMSLYHSGKETLSPPTGFVAGCEEQLRFAEAAGWEMHVHACTELQSGFHSSGFKIAHLLPKSSPSVFSTHASTIPDDLSFVEGASRLKDVLNLPNGEAQSHAMGSVGSPESVINNATSSTIIEPRSALRRGPHARMSTTERITMQAPRSSWPGPSQRQVSRSPSAQAHRRKSQQLFASNRVPEQIPDTQTSNIHEMKLAFSKMMQPEDLSQGQTQPATHQMPPQADSFLSMLSQDLEPSTANSKEQGATTSNMTKPELSQSVAQKLESNKTKLRSHAQSLSKTRTKRSQGNTSTVLCQCGYSKKEDDMVQCDTCNKWQHLHCYGFTGSDDPRLPEQHVCYQCLLDGQESHTLQMLNELALKRRAVHCVFKHGTAGEEELAAALEVKRPVANSLFLYLRSHGFLVPSTTSRSRSVSALSNALRFSLVKEGFAYEEMCQALFEPLLHISHHYDRPEQATTQSAAKKQTLARMQEDTLQPPPTPACNTVIEADSGLDLRASLPLYQTPMCPWTGRTRSLKRLLSQSEASESNRGRENPRGSAKRVKIARSEFTIDARGLPSSPTIFTPQ